MGWRHRRGNPRTTTTEAPKHDISQERCRIWESHCTSSRRKQHTEFRVHRTHNIRPDMCFVSFSFQSQGSTDSHQQQNPSSARRWHWTCAMLVIMGCGARVEFDLAWTACVWCRVDSWKKK